MISKIKKIKNLGIFPNYSWDPALGEFKRYNLLYGWNGSGKSTLSHLFSCLEEGSSTKFPDLEYQMETESGICKDGEALNCKVRVFDEDYVTRNIEILSGKAKSIFILGEENKTLAEQIDADVKKLEELVTLKKEKEVERDRKNKQKGEQFTTIASVIGANLVGSSTRNYRKPDAEKDFEALDQIRILSDEELANQQLIIKQDQKDKINEINPDTGLDLDILVDKVKSICRETVTVNAIEEISNDSILAAWVETGLSIHNEKSKKCCFCDSEMPPGRIERLMDHFNDADKKLKHKIDIEIEHIKGIIKEIRALNLPNKAQFYLNLQTLYTSRLLGFNQEKEKLIKDLSELLEILNSKKAKTTEEVLCEKSVENNFTNALSSINEIIKDHNQKTDDFQAEKDKAVLLVKNHHLGTIASEVNDIKNEIQDCENLIELLENGDDSDHSIPCISKLKHSIRENKAKISSEHKACDVINKQLITFLGRKELEFEVAEEGGYLIKRNGVEAKYLSEGEKTAIAFVYFVVHLEDQEFNIKDGIVVVDDPISSLDSNSLFQAFAFLKNAVKDAKQVFLLTHNFSFLKLLVNWLNNFPEARNNKGGKAYYMVDNYFDIGVRYARLKALDKLLENHQSEYHYLFKRIYKYESDGTIECAYDIPNVARKVLDTFLMFRVPNGATLYKKLDSLDFDQNKKAAIYKFVNDMSHITGDGFDPSLVAETQKNVKYLLEMIESVFPEHYNILVQESGE